MANQLPSSHSPHLPRRLSPKAMAKIPLWEAQRQKSLRHFYVISAVIMLLIGLITWWLLSHIVDRDTRFFLVIMAGFVLVVAELYFAHSQDKDFIRWLKRNALEDFIKEFPQLHWHGAANTDFSMTIPDEQLKRSGLFLDFDRREIDDEYWGAHEGIPFKISETCLKTVTHDCRNHHDNETIVFKGVVVAFTFPQRIKNRTLVADKYSLTQKEQIYFTALMILSTIIGALDSFLKKGTSLKEFMIIAPIVVVASLIGMFIYRSKTSPQEALDPVILEDPYFNKRFKVFSSDQVEARYLVTTSFMERVMKFRKNFGGKRVKCAFFDQTFMVAIPTKKNVFEIGSVFKRLEDPTTIRKFYQELHAVFSLIEHFKLNQFIYRHDAGLAKKRR